MGLASASLKLALDAKGKPSADFLLSMMQDGLKEAITRTMSFSERALFITGNPRTRHSPKSKRSRGVAILGVVVFMLLCILMRMKIINRSNDRCSFFNNNNNQMQTQWGEGSENA